MNGSILDTNIIIDIFRGKKEVINQLSNLKHIYIPSIVLGELYYGAFQSEREKAHLEQINEFLARVNTIPINQNTSKIYGKVKSNLKDKGKPIPENDIWIASLAIQYDLDLFSNDFHFEFVDGIKLSKIV